METHNQRVVRGVLSVGFLLVIALPPQHKEWAAVALNLFWLWKG